MAYTITINAVDRTADVIARSVSITDVINDKQNICSFRLADLSLNGIPNTGEEITIVDAESTKVFGGYITRVSVDSKANTGAVIASIECIDYVWLLDRNLAHVTYEDMTDAQIINALVNTYCPGFGITTTNVVSGVTIDQISFNYIQISQALRQICDLTGRNWYIDYDKDIHYFALTAENAPFNISDDDIGVEYVNETLASSTSGVLGGDATQESGYVQLTPNSASSSGSLTWTEELNHIFICQFESQITGGGGADSTYFFWSCSSIPYTEESNPGGFLVAFDTYQEEIQIWFAGTKLAYIEQTGIEDVTWQDVKIVVSNNVIDVYWNDVLKINYDAGERVLPGDIYGFGARTGAVTDYHRIRNVLIYHPEASDYTNLVLKKDASQIKNRVYVRGGTKLSDFTTYAELGDGEKRQFILPDKPHEVSIEVNGTPETVGIKHVHTSGYDWYLNFQEKYVEQDGGGAVLTNSDTIEVTYKYDIPILVALENASSIEEYGQREFAIFDKKITTTQSARDRASAELTDYAANIIEGSFITHTAGFVSGQYINIDLNDYDVDDNYIVQSVNAKSLGAGIFQYKVSLASAKTIGIIRFLIELLEINRNLIELDDNESVDELFNLTDQLLSDSLVEDLTIDSAGAYFTWVEDSPAGTIKTRMRWDLFQWG